MSSGCVTRPGSAAFELRRSCERAAGAMRSRFTVEPSGYLRFCAGCDLAVRRRGRRRGALANGDDVPGYEHYCFANLTAAEFLLPRL